MVLSLAIPIRAAYQLEDLITMRHIDNMAKVMLATGLMVGYGYTMEAFFAWYSASPHERFMMWNRMFGPYGWSYWTLHHREHRPGAAALVQERAHEH